MLFLAVLLFIIAIVIANIVVSAVIIVQSVVFVTSLTAVCAPVAGASGVVIVAFPCAELKTLSNILTNEETEMMTKCLHAFTRVCACLCVYLKRHPLIPSQGLCLSQVAWASAET